MHYINDFSPEQMTPDLVEFKIKELHTTLSTLKSILKHKHETLIDGKEIDDLSLLLDFMEDTQRASADLLALISKQARENL